MTDEPSIIVPFEAKNFNGCLLVVTYYGFKKPILNACQAFANEKNWVVVEFPMFRYRNDVNDKTETYIDMFCETVTKYNPDAILFWYHFLTPQELELIQSNIDEKVPFILFNWDDPFSWHDEHGHIAHIAKFFDGVLTSSRRCVSLYSEAMQKNAKRREKFANPVIHYCLPGFDEAIANQVFEKNQDSKYVCDVLFITTNLYEDDRRYNKQRVSRAKIVDALYEKHTDEKLVFHIYGPEFLAKRYPLSYQGYCDYEKQYEINQTARIVLNTHVVCEQGYCNERFCVALGCGSIIISDIAQPDIFQNNDSGHKESLSVYDLGDNVEQTLQNIFSILEKPANEYNNERNKNRKIAAKNLSWGVWARMLYRTLESLSIQGKKENANKIAKLTSITDKNRWSEAASHSTLGEWDKKDFLDALDEQELNTELEKTIFYHDSSALPTLVVPYERQCQLSSLITSIRDQSNSQDLKKFVDIIEANPDLDINNVLEFHWSHIDK